VGREKGAHLVKHLLSDAHDESGVLGGREKTDRREQSAGGVGPTDQRLIPDDTAIGQRHDRLVVNHKLGFVQSASDLVLDNQACQCLGVHGVIEESPAGSSRRLGAEQGRVGIAQQAGAGGTLHVEGDSDGDGGHNSVTTDGQFSPYGGHYPLGDKLGLVCVLEIGDNDDELVAARAAHPVLWPQDSSDPVRYRHQDLIAGRVTQRVVHNLEVVQVDEEYAHRAATGRCVAQVTLQLVHDPGSVAQTRKRVVERLVGKLIQGVVLSGGVGVLDQQIVGAPGPTRDQLGGLLDPQMSSIRMEESEDLHLGIEASIRFAGDLSCSLARDLFHVVRVRHVPFLVFKQPPFGPTEQPAQRPVDHTERAVQFGHRQADR